MKHSNIAFFVPHSGCPHTCSFCNQKSISGRQKPPTPEEIRTICERALRDIPAERRAETEIAFFGGSFTAIAPAFQTVLLEAAAPFVGRDRFAGIRISTRPDCISEEILLFLKKYSVSAIELGVQSMDDRVLRLNERGHSAKQAAAAAKLIRSFGFSLGLQMMTGLYGDSEESVYYTAKQIISCQPDTVRIYPTVVIRGTKLAALYQSGAYQPWTTEKTIPIAADLMMQFEQAGIRVIRVGLHASPELEQDMLAGAYHPAFRELCEGELYYRLILAQLADQNSHVVTVFVAPHAVSRAVGQSKRNLIRLKEAGYAVRVRPDSGLQRYEVQIEPENSF